MVAETFKHSQAQIRHGVLDFLRRDVRNRSRTFQCGIDHEGITIRHVSQQEFNDA